MLSDYFLTIAGARSRASAYASHFRTRHYELNPIWQNAVSKLRWINKRHLFVTAVIGVVLLAMSETLRDADEFVELVEGGMIGALGSVNGRHLSNLATFGYAKRHPDSVEGSVTMSHAFVLWISTFQTFALFVPAVLLACYLPRPIVIGFAGGLAMLIAVHLVWIRRHRRKGGDAKLTIDHVGTVDVDASSDSSASGTKRP
jgi:hypothetical protein